MEPDRSLDNATWETRREGRATALHVRCVRLEVMAGPDRGLVQTFSDSVLRLGSHKRCDLVLHDRRVSRFHCELSLDERGYRVRDLGSTNGTFVGGVRVHDAYLPPGTRLRLGETEIVLIPLGESVEIELADDVHFCGLVGGSVAMRRLYAYIERIAGSTATVLITGETGTGKGLVAEAIHESSPRASGPLVVLDCGAVPATLFEDELFGHERGAFTTAVASAPGAFERAHGGTLFLDEIGELPLELQPKLLRAVESRRVRRIGGLEEIQCDVRLVAATNRDLPVEVNRRRFRSDLYYRLAVALIQVPPLRERRDDIPVLVDHMLAMLAEGQGPRPTLAPAVVAALEEQPWPGNVRELRNAVERAVLAEDPPGAAASAAAAAAAAAVGPGGDRWTRFLDIDLPFKEARRRLEREFDRRFVSALLERHAWNISAVARAARLDRMTVYKMISRLGLSRPDT